MLKNRHIVKNEVLKAAIFGGYLSDKYEISGFLNSNDVHGISRALLTHLVQRLYGIYRYPGFEETSVYNKRHELWSVFPYITEEIVSAACEELEVIKQHTQEYLKEKKKKENLERDSLSLTRSLNPYEEYQVCEQILAGINPVKYHANILMSFADTNNIGSYGSNITIRKEIRFEDILMHYDVIEYRGINQSPEVKENEIWVVNKNFLGMVSLDENKDELLYSSSCMEMKKREIERTGRTSFSEPPRIPKNSDFWNFSIQKNILNTKKKNKRFFEWLR